MLIEQVVYKIMRFWLFALNLTLTVCACCGASYQTTFANRENPISEGGMWLNGKADGLDWSNVVSSAGVAVGTQVGNGTGAGAFTDSTALLTGTWGPDQMAQATVRIFGTDVNTYEEVELRLRSSISAHGCAGYEIDYSIVGASPYVTIVRWNGPLGDFTYLTDYRAPNAAYYVRDGDVIKGTAISNTITLYINNVAITNITDGTFTNGNPGIGFSGGNNGGTVHSTNWGFSSFMATDNVVRRPSPPTNLHEVPP